MYIPLLNVTFSIFTINVRGLSNSQKRRIIFDRFRNQSDLLIMQETHSSEECHKLWENEWGGKAIMSHGDSKSRGVAIFIKRKTDISVKNIEIDTAGRYLICDVHENTSVVTIIALYGPNKDSPNFFDELGKKLQERSEKKILIGDFKLVLDVDLDRLNTYHNNQKAKEKILDIMEQYSLKDVWRVRNPMRREFLWTKKDISGRKASRIDFALIFAGLDSKVENCMYADASHTDHRPYFIAIDIDYIERGTGFWKLNTMLVQDLDYVELMRKNIIGEIESLTGSAREIWEKVKQKIQMVSKEYSRSKGNEDKIAIAQLTEKVTEMNQRLHLGREEDVILEETKIELEELCEKRIRGVMFRSKAKWYELGGKSSKYFFALEKAKYNAKTCYALFTQSGEIVRDPKEILEEQRKFFKKLYSKDDFVRFDLQNTSGIKVSEEHKVVQDELISEDEIKVAIKSMNNNKTPGQDGIPIEFYKIFWKDISKVYMDMVEEVYQDEKLHESARSGILNLIPKQDKDTRYIKNLWLITLLNTDYKIIEKVIANKMTPALQTIIHQDQRGFMKDRRISVNIRKLLDIVQYAKDSNLEAVILTAVVLIYCMVV